MFNKKDSEIPGNNDNDKTKVAVINDKNNGFDILMEKTNVIDKISNALDDGKPIIAGVNYTMPSTTGNDDKTTDHWIVIYKCGTDENGKEYIQYIETGRYQANWSEATKEGNKLYYDDTSRMFEGDSYHKNKDGDTDIYKLSQLRIK